MPVSVPHGSLARPGASPVAAGAVSGDGPKETGLDAYDPVIDVFGDLALVRYWLRVDFAPAPDGGRLRPELVRNTALLRKGDDGKGGNGKGGDDKGADGTWRIVHLHEDVRQPGGVPETAG